MINAKTLLIGMQDRNISFRTLQNIIKENGIPSARGWSPLIDAYSGKAGREHFDILKEIYDSQLIYGRRNIYYSCLGELSQIEGLVKTLKKINGAADKVVVGKYNESYPLPISSDELENMSTLPVPMQVIESDNTLRIIFCYPRRFKERDVIDVDNLSDEEKVSFGSYDELIGVRHGVVQAFDSILLDKKNGNIQFQIDICCTMSNEDFDTAARFYRRMVIDSFYNRTRKHLSFKKKNIFSKILELYQEKGGVIADLGHATGTGSLKGEKMRRKGEDLRKEAFHQAGITAISGKTNLYSITKQWYGARGNRLTIEIPGNVALASASKPFIDHAIIEGCSDESDFNLLNSKLEKL
ncbi:hypothetical protein [Serratia ficaria]|uniref:hypothetical protein n=1 Tax=Serratia ficaria TaxID=61651 RepID=UPI0021778C4C|nr:hypothetical protein [Serratia ficaria]CAI1806196.1 Uncharacterised protein [Serratia ficaria]